MLFRSDGSIVVGKKIFKKRDDYIPLSRDKENIKVDETVAVAKEECSKQTNDIVGANRGTNFLVTCDCNGNFGTYYQPVVLDSDNGDNSVLGGTIHSGGATSNSVSPGIEENIRECKGEEEKEE